MLELCYTSCKREGAGMMTKSTAVRTAAVPTIVAVLIIFALALRTARTGTRQSSAPSAARTPESKDAVTFYIAGGAGSTGFRPGDRELALWAFQAWQRNAGK